MPRTKIHRDAALDEIVRICTEERNTLDINDVAALYCIITDDIGTNTCDALAEDYTVLDDETFIVNP